MNAPTNVKWGMICGSVIGVLWAALLKPVVVKNDEPISTLVVLCIGVITGIGVGRFLAVLWETVRGK
jgi:sorbitol-specific phosphotransferase system component IIBC